MLVIEIFFTLQSQLVLSIQSKTWSSFFSALQKFKLLRSDSIKRNYGSLILISNFWWRFGNLLSTLFSRSLTHLLLVNRTGTMGWMKHWLKSVPKCALVRKLKNYLTQPSTSNLNFIWAFAPTKHICKLSLKGPLTLKQTL